MRTPIEIEQAENGFIITYQDLLTTKKEVFKTIDEVYVFIEKWFPEDIFKIGG